MLAVYAYAGLLVALMSLWMAFGAVKRLCQGKCCREARPRALVEAAWHAATRCEEDPDSPATRKSMVTSAGVKASWLELGSPGEGPLAVLIHGFPDHARSWLGTMQVLRSLGFCAVAVDLRGYGESGAPDPASGAVYDARAGAEDVLEVLAAVQRRQATTPALKPLLVGHDLGGQVAWLLATEHASSFSACVIAASPHPALARANVSASQVVRSFYIPLLNLPSLAVPFLRANGARRVGGALAETRSLSDVAGPTAAALRCSDGSTAPPPPATLPAGSEALAPALVPASTAARAFARKAVCTVLDAASLRHLREEFSRPGRVAAALGWYRGLLAPESRARMASLALPEHGGVAVSLPLANLAAEFDLALGPELVAGTRRVAPHGASAVVPRASHWLPLERPGSIVGAALELLLWAGHVGSLPARAAAVARSPLGHPDGSAAMLAPDAPLPDGTVHFVDTGHGLIAPLVLPRSETADDVTAVRAALRSGLREALRPPRSK
ncbi:hypothetical protein FNF27_05797 [Cafeteria roenbergensis]|uniref:AB hydrolase-1 domain-containing protein n=2 Tax=Cafeteria roenbergensis TaxID=33653 RepID=A0A5A8E780_CAFRO|nr:hypothetical protein FNF27_05797 [Cafeteria roenbergensis]